MASTGVRLAAASLTLSVFSLDPVAAAFAQSSSEISCATAQSAEAPTIRLSDAEMEDAHRAQNRLGSFQIVIVPGSGLSGNAPALAAFTRAADQWEAFFSDPITVTIDADLVALGSPSVIGSTASVLLGASYTTIRNAMVADAGDEADDTIIASMPTSAQVSFTMPSGFPYSGDLTASKANLKALGFTGLDDMVGASDGTIYFNSAFAFDYDNSNGVSPSTVDFESVAAHEIGHLLGFRSEVDYIDNLVHAGLTDSIDPSVLDTIRFRFDASNPSSSAQFTTTARNMEYNRASVTDEIAVELRMSTGAWNGDGRQASHWRDDALSGVYIGAMDPNIASQQIHDIQPSDARALDLIGYDRGQCGNGTIDPSEQCDDSNVSNGDCCSSLCQYEANGSACTSDSNQCTNDVCNSTGTCLHTNVSNGTSCNDGLFCNGADQCASGVCSIHLGNSCASGPECNNVCNEAADNCVVPNGTACTTDSNPCTNDVCGSGACTHPANTASCDDGLFCNGSDTCSGGACVAHSGDPCAAGSDCSDVCTETTDSCIAPAGSPCDDEGEVCTADTCDGAGTCEHTFDEMAAPQCSGNCPLTPQEGCFAPTKHTLQIADSTEAGKDKMSWKWQQGDEFNLLHLLGPGGSLASRLCVYSGTGPGATLLLEAKVQDSGGTWTATGKGTKYRDKDGTQDGVTSIKTKTGLDLKTSVQIKRKGTLTLPAPFDGTNLFDPASTVVVQVGNSAGSCWSAAFAASEMKINEPDSAKVTDETIVCGDGSRDRGEQCDDTDDAGCPGGCNVACMCVP